MTKRLNIVLVLLLLIVGVPYYWLLLDNRPGNAVAKPIHIEDLRRLAASIPGQAPVAVEVQHVAWRRLPGNLLVAGSGMKRKLVSIMAFRLLVPGGKPVLIDSGITAKDAAAMNLEDFAPERQAKVEAAMDTAGLILLTHEHPDHEGALVAHGGTALSEAAILNQAQLPPARPAANLDWKGRNPPAARITGSAPRAVAPGIVVIPAPSHTPGSQMIYVRLADGRELLFTGDIATFAQSWQEIRARSNLVTKWFAPENRGEVFSWLLTIKALSGEAPELVVIPGHDYLALFDKDHPSQVSDGFGSLPPFLLHPKSF